MGSSTSSKREIVDFLWDWATQTGDWGKLLISEIVNNENELSEDSVKKVFDYFLQSINLKTGLPQSGLAKPTYSFSTKRIEITSLSDVNGVNKLVANQIVRFGENVTVVFGENGSGKTGYSRILKALGYSYDVQNTILNDVSKPAMPQAAKIKYKIDGVDNEFVWNGKNKNNDLTNLSIFNNNCVQISLTDGRGLLVSPIGFHLFNIVSSELGKLARLLQEEIDRHPTMLSWETQLHSGTPQHNFVSILKGSSKISTLDDLAQYNEPHKKLLSDTETQLKNLNRALLEKELTSHNMQLYDLEVFINKAIRTKQILDVETWNKLIELNKELGVLEAKAKVGLKEIAEHNGIKFYQSNEFQTFIKAADEYIRILGNAEYPFGDNDTCIYCKQTLSNENAKNLLDSYKILLNDDTQELIKKRKEKIASIIKQINSIEIPLVLHQDAFGKEADGKIIQPIELTNFNKEISKFKTLINESKDLTTSTFNFDYDTHIDFLEKKKENITAAIESKKEILENISAKEKELTEIINQLKDREFISKRIEEIKKYHINKTIVSTLLSNKNAFSTNAISRKTSEARDELVQQKFNDLFIEELKALRKSNIKIEFGFGTMKGQSKLQQRILSHSLSDVLSEGEQKSIALAEFLTELQLDNSQAPVIFDDPVNSLDHQIIEDVSRRLLTLSRKRQVIVFTHSVLLFNSIMHHCKLATYKDLKSILYDIWSDYGQTGNISVTTADVEKVKIYTAKINSLLQNRPKERRENEIAAEGFGELRSAIELSVEHHIFRGIVKRYQSNIALTNLVKVDGILLNKHKDKLNEIYERCCRYTNAHSNPEEVITQPTVEELKLDFETFMDIHKQFPQN